eukprot:scaffold85995_cov52-Prasinocladus_malaysianus.AAC.1
MLHDEPGLGEHHRGAILLLNGQFLNDSNELEDLPHRESHTGTQVLEVPVAIKNLLSLLKEAAGGAACHDKTIQAKVTASIKECLKAVTP